MYFLMQLVDVWMPNMYLYEEMLPTNTTKLIMKQNLG
jgi:hypothetical protein